MDSHCPSATAIGGCSEVRPDRCRKKAVNRPRRTHSYSAKLRHSFLSSHLNPEARVSAEQTYSASGRKRSRRHRGGRKESWPSSVSGRKVIPIVSFPQVPYLVPKPTISPLHPLHMRRTFKPFFSYAQVIHSVVHILFTKLNTACSTRHAYQAL